MDLGGQGAQIWNKGEKRTVDEGYSKQACGVVKLMVFGVLIYEQLYRTYFSQDFWHLQLFYLGSIDIALFTFLF